MRHAFRSDAQIVDAMVALAGASETSHRIQASVTGQSPSRTE